MTARCAISLFDHSGLALRPWADAGFECHAYDIQNTDGIVNGIHMHKADLFRPSVLKSIERTFASKCTIAIAFPPCTELSVAGARWWASKAQSDPDFQRRAVRHIVAVARTFDALGCPYMIENPRSSILNSMWRKCDHSFEPYQYGGYLPRNDVHPLYPRQIPPRDAYTKNTGLWTSPNFTMPVHKPIPPIHKSYVTANGGTEPQRFSYILSGFTPPNVRSCSPRGFFIALQDTWPRV